METYADPLTQHVQDHYDRISKLYQTLWGDHIHHGYWEANEPTAVAQIKLIEKLVEWAGVKTGSQVLDVGCGVGGSSLWLAQNWRCSVLGVTLSPAQVKTARQRARRFGLVDRVQFDVMDANQLQVPSETFDVVWAIESTEHVHDKSRLTQNFYGALKPGGTLAICAWTDTSSSDEGKNIVNDICDRMICPALGRPEEYQRWMSDAGFENVRAKDVTAHVARTWDLCVDIVNRKDVRLLLKALDQRTRRFAESFPTMKKAFATGAMGYGMFAARKPIA